MEQFQLRSGAVRTAVWLSIHKKINFAIRFANKADIPAVVSVSIDDACAHAAIAEGVAPPTEL